MIGRVSCKDPLLHRPVERRMQHDVQPSDTRFSQSAFSVESTIAPLVDEWKRIVDH